MTNKTEEDWDARFGGAIETSEGTTHHETYGADLEAVEAADPMTVWTIVEGDETDNLYLVPGFHAVNRIGYVLAEKPITQAELDSGEWDEVVWVDGDDNDNEPGAGIR